MGLALMYTCIRTRIYIYIYNVTSIRTFYKYIQDDGWLADGRRMILLHRDGIHNVYCGTPEGTAAAKTRLQQWRKTIDSVSSVVSHPCVRRHANRKNIAFCARTHVINIVLIVFFVFANKHIYCSTTIALAPACTTMGRPGRRVCEEWAVRAHVRIAQQ